MAENGNPSTRKPRKKRKSVNFMTRKQKEQTKVQRNQSTRLESLASSKHDKDEVEASPIVASTSRMDTSKRSTPKHSRAMQQDNESENSSPSSSKENTLEISTSGNLLNKRGSGKSMMSTKQSKAPSHTHRFKSPSKASTNKMDTSKESTPKNSRAMQQDNDSENSSPSSSKENSLVISTSGKNNKGSGKSIMSTKQSKAPFQRFKSPISKVQRNEEPDLNTKTKKRKRQSVNFITAKQKRAPLHHQSMTGHTLKRGDKVSTNATTFDNSTSSISKLSDTPGELDGRLDSRSSGSFRPESRSSVGRPRTTQKRKLTGDNVQETTPGRQVKKRKQSKAENKETSLNTSFTSITSSIRGRGKSKKKSNHVALDRIRDLKVTKKAFEKWKPMSKATIGFVEAILKSVVLNVSAETNLENDADAATCLTTLKTKVMERLPNLKAPYTKGDYGKMESQNKMSEDVYLEKSRELNVLDKKIEEEQRLLDKQTSIVAEFKKKLENYENELETLEREKAHPLIQQTRNVLKLPQLPDIFFIEDEMSIEESEEEKKLSKTLLQLRQNANDAPLTKWMDKLTVFTKNIHAH